MTSIYPAVREGNSKHPPALQRIARASLPNIGPTPELKMVDRRKLKIDPSYQRTDEISINNIAKIASEFNWNLFGALMISRRPNDDLYIMDGQHRWRSSERVKDAEFVPCAIYNISSVAEEARIFHELNTKRTKVSTFARLKAAVIAGDKEAVEIDSFLRSVGFPPGTIAAKPPCLKCLDAVMKIWRNDINLTKECLKQLREVTPLDEAPHNVVVNAAYFLAKYTDGRSLDKKWTRRMKIVGQAKIQNALLVRGSHKGKAEAALILAKLLNSGQHLKLDITKLAMAIGGGDD